MILRAMTSIKIVDYQPKYQPYFEKLNRQWIEEYFVMEPLDEFVLTNPEEAILKNGGAILMALYNEEVAGTVALRKLNKATFEFTKMAVDKNFRRKGIAGELSYASFQKARSLGISKILLYSNTKNAAAIKLYEKLGFKHLPVETDIYKRANVKMTIELDKVELDKNYSEL